MIIYLLPHDHEIVESVHHTRQLDCVTLVHHHVLWLQYLKKIDYDELLESKRIEVILTFTWDMNLGFLLLMISLWPVESKISLLVLVSG